MNIGIDKIALEFLDAVAVIGDMLYNLFFSLNNIYNIFYIKRNVKVAAEPQREYM